MSRKISSPCFTTSLIQAAADALSCVMTLMSFLFGSFGGNNAVIDMKSLQESNDTPFALM